MGTFGHWLCVCRTCGAVLALQKPPNHTGQCLTPGCTTPPKPKFFGLDGRALCTRHTHLEPNTRVYTMLRWYYHLTYLQRLVNADWHLQSPDIVRQYYTWSEIADSDLPGRQTGWADTLCPGHWWSWLDITQHLQQQFGSFGIDHPIHHWLQAPSMPTTQ